MNGGVGKISLEQTGSIIRQWASDLGVLKFMACLVTENRCTSEEARPPLQLLLKTKTRTEQNMTVSSCYRANTCILSEALLGWIWRHKYMIWIMVSYVIVCHSPPLYMLRFCRRFYGWRASSLCHLFLTFSITGDMNHAAATVFVAVIHFSLRLYLGKAISSLGPPHHVAGGGSATVAISFFFYPCHLSPLAVIYKLWMRQWWTFLFSTDDISIHGRRFGKCHSPSAAWPTVLQMIM